MLVEMFENCSHIQPPQLRRWGLMARFLQNICHSISFATMLQPWPWAAYLRLHVITPGRQSQNANISSTRGFRSHLTNTNTSLDHQWVIKKIESSLTSWNDVSGSCFNCLAKSFKPRNPFRTKPLRNLQVLSTALAA